MKKKNIIQQLQERYNIPENELVEIGLITEETLSKSLRISKKDKEVYSLICTKKDVTPSTDIREAIVSLLEEDDKTQKEIANKIRVMEADKRRGGFQDNIPYVLTRNQHNKVKKFCRQYGIRYFSSLAKYFVITTVEKEGGSVDDILR